MLDPGGELINAVGVGPQGHHAHTPQEACRALYPIASDLRPETLFPHMVVRSEETVLPWLILAKYAHELESWHLPEHAARLVGVLNCGLQVARALQRLRALHLVHTHDHCLPPSQLLGRALLIQSQLAQTDAAECSGLLGSCQLVWERPTEIHDLGVFALA